MIPHSFAKVGEGQGKLLMFFQPAGKWKCSLTRSAKELPAKCQKKNRMNSDMNTALKR